MPPRDAPAVRRTTPPLATSGPQSTPAPPDYVWLGSSQSITVTITTRAGHPYIPVLLDGHPATLMVDTAAQGTMLDPDAMDNPESGVASLQIGELRFPRLAPVRARVREYTDTFLGEAADGIIGADLLARYPVLLDFQDRELTIFRDGKTASAALPAGAQSFPLRVIGGQPAVQASLDGQTPLWFSLSTGADYPVQLDPGAEQAHRYAHAEHWLPFQVVSPLGGAAGRLVRARSLQLGSLDFNQPLVALLSLPRAPAVAEPAGSLGAATLSHLSLLVDETSSSATFFAPPGALAARLYEPSGIALMMRRGTIVVRSVVPGTPAEAAHIRPGDEIVSIGGLAPATLEFARQLLDGAPGSRVAIVYKRWHITHYTTVTLRVII